MSSSGSSRKVAHSLVALSSAAVLSVYGAGYARTRAAADRFASPQGGRRPHVPAPERIEAPRAPAKPIVVSPEAPPPNPDHVIGLPETPSVDPARSAVSRPIPRQTERAAADRQPTAGAGSIASSDVASPQASDASSETSATSPAEPGATRTQEPAPAQPPVASAPAAEKAPYRDGTYFGWGTSRHGDIQAAVVVEDGRIASASIAQCLTRYSCSWIAALPPQIVRRQGTTYDYVSGATESSDAFQDAVADALTHAQ